jgi:small-conductance mechanosensitive channel
MQMRLLWLAAAMMVVVGLIGGIVAMVIRFPDMAVAVPILAAGLAVALQKYTASFFGYFVINFSRIYGPGDRIRIGNIKGDVRWVGLIHTTLEEVGEDEKLGGELTGRILHVPNLVILDQPVLNYSKDYSVHQKAITSDYMFDEVRIPLTTDSNIAKASQLLENILRVQEDCHLKEAREMFQNGYPKFLNEATGGPRILVHIEPQRIWINGKFVAPIRDRNQLRSRILVQFMERAKANTDVKLA